MDYRKPTIERVEIGSETVCIRSLSAAAWRALQDQTDPIEATIRLIQQSICDAEGNLIYSAEDVPMLLENMPFDHVTVLSDRIAELNGLEKKS